MFFSPSLVRIDSCQESRWLLVPNPHVLDYNSGLVINQGANARQIIRIAQAKFAVMTTFRFPHCTFYGVENDLDLDSRLMTHDIVLMKIPSAVAADIDKLGLLYIVSETQFDASTSIVAFQHLRDLDWTAMGSVSAVRYLPCRYLDGTVLTGVN